MPARPSSSLLDKITTELTSKSPDIGSLIEFLQSEYCIDADDASVLLYHIVSELNSQLFPPITKTELLLTRNCNLKCAYCFEQSIRDNSKMPVSVALAAIDLLFAYSKDTKEVYITFFGGEPTLNFPLLQKATEYAEKNAKEKNKKVHFNMTSNGVAFSDKMIKYFSEHNIKVLLSIDGLKPTHDRFRTDLAGRGSFDRVMASMKKLKKGMPWVGAKLTITKECVPRLFTDIVGLHKLGVNQFLFGPATMEQWDNDDLDTYFDQLHKLFCWYQQEDKKTLRIPEFEEKYGKDSYYGCQAARDNISVDVDGTITGCSKILSLEKEKTVGKLGDVAHGLTHLSERLAYISCDALKDSCAHLGIDRQYYGGCFASNYEETKDVFKPNKSEHAFSNRLREEINRLLEYQ